LEAQRPQRAESRAAEVSVRHTKRQMGVDLFLGWVRGATATTTAAPPLACAAVGAVSERSVPSEMAAVRTRGCGAASRYSN